MGWHVCVQAGAAWAGHERGGGACKSRPLLAPRATPARARPPPTTGLAALGGRLPRDVQQDAAHVYRELMALAFTEGELSGAWDGGMVWVAASWRPAYCPAPPPPLPPSALLHRLYHTPLPACAETEEAELERVQHHNSGTPHAAAAAPPAAPPDQFTSPGAALGSGAVAASKAAAARALAPAPPLLPTEIQQQVQQRQALAGAAAVAHEAAVEVLLAKGVEEEVEPAEGELGEEGQIMRQEMSEEAADAAAAAAGPIVVTPAGETALAPEAPAKGAGEGSL